MKRIKGSTDPSAITGSGKQIVYKAADNILGYSLQVPADSANNALVSINGAPAIVLNIGDPSFGVGGFAIGDKPVLFEDQLDVSFETTNPGANRCILIAIRLTECKD